MVIFFYRSCYSSGEHPSPRLVQWSIWTGAGLYVPKQRFSTHGNKRTHDVHVAACFTQVSLQICASLLIDGRNRTHSLQHL